MCESEPRTELTPYDRQLSHEAEIRGSMMMDDGDALTCSDALAEQKSSNKVPAYCYWLAAIACLNSCNLGYDVGSVGGAALLMMEDMDWKEWQLGLFVGSINFFSIVGALNAGVFCDRFGRRRTFTISSLIFIIGVLIQVLSSNFAIAMVGRLCVGMGIGLGLSIDPLYISEMSPPELRGKLVSFSEIAINVGITMGFIADYLLYTLPLGVNWRIMLALGIVMPLILIILTFTVMPESPRWLILKGRTAEALAILKKTYPPGADLSHVLRSVEKHIEIDQEAARTSWSAILRPTPPVRLMLMAGVGIAACQQISGTESLVYFSPKILEQSGFTSRQQTFGLTILIGFSKTSTVLVSAYQADRLGRRPLILASTAGLAACLVMMAIFSAFPQLGGAMLFSMCCYVGFFGLAMGPICWMATSEIFPTTIRAKANALSTSVNRLVSGSVACTTPTLTRLLYPTGFFLFYAVLTALSGLYLFRYFPETKGKSLEEVEDHFNALAAEKGWSAPAPDAL